MSADAARAPASAARPGWLRLWWNAHFSDFTRREAWGYGVWLFFGVIVAVPEIWAAFWKESAPFPTISGTTGALEFDHPWVAMIVAGTIVLCIYSSYRYPKTRTGVLPKHGPGGIPLGLTERLRGILGELDDGAWAAQISSAGLRSTQGADGIERSREFREAL